jgi:hypothetical protein
MWRQQKALARLHQELNTLALFDRIHAYTQHPSLADNRAAEFRQMRRTQIMAEIAELSPSKLAYGSRIRTSSAILLLCAGAYAMLHYLFHS